MKTTHLFALAPTLLLAGCLPLPSDQATPPTPNSADTSTSPAETERVEAEVGVGKSTQNLGKYDSGVQKAVAAPAQALFKTKEKVAFEFQIKPAMELYRASNGNYPKTHDEFMEKIIKPNRIELPELPQGQSYVYDPEDATLYVERPKTEQK